MASMLSSDRARTTVSAVIWWAWASDVVGSTCARRIDVHSAVLPQPGIPASRVQYAARPSAANRGSMAREQRRRYPGHRRQPPVPASPRRPAVIRASRHPPRDGRRSSCPSWRSSSASSWSSRPSPAPRSRGQPAADDRRRQRGRADHARRRLPRRRRRPPRTRPAGRRRAGAVPVGGRRPARVGGHRGDRRRPSSRSRSASSAPRGRSSTTPAGRMGSDSRTWSATTRRYARAARATIRAWVDSGTLDRRHLPGQRWLPDVADHRSCRRRVRHGRQAARGR